jgi:flagellar hook-associated protein 3 FlgL
MMKISTHLMFERASSQMSTVQGNLTQSQAQLAQGKQVINASDAPDQAATIQRMKSLISRQDSYKSSLTTVKIRLESEDSTLQNVTTLLIRAKEVAVHAANDTLSPDNRKALGIEMKALRDQMLSLANTKDNNGNYIFSGSRVQQPAFASNSNGSPNYQGDQTEMRVRVSEQFTIPLNRPGTAAFKSVARTTADGAVTGVGYFKVMDDLIAGINNSEPPNITRGVSELDNLLEGVTLAHADVGTNLNVIDQQTSVIEDTILNLKSTLSNIEDLDFASAITKMNQQMLSLQAAQSSFAKISQLNLFEYIR